jgi:hypothetical protein
LFLSLFFFISFLAIFWGPSISTFMDSLALRPTSDPAITDVGSRHRRRGGIPEIAFAHRHFYTQKLLPTASFQPQKLLHTEVFTHRCFYTQKLLHT